ncbi:MAG: hypothetical protein ACHQYP_10815 [Nitrospiria bacterium]
MIHAEQPESKPLVQFVQQEKRNLDDDRIAVVLDFDFYLRPHDHLSPISREIKHSSHTTDISSKGFGFLYPAKPSLEDDYERSGSISKNIIIEVYLYVDQKRFRFNAQRVWSQLIYIDDTRYFRYGAKWLYPNANQEVSLKYVLDSLKNNPIIS